MMRNAMLTGPSTPDHIALSHLGGMSLLSGEDETGMVWVEFKMEASIGQARRTCAICRTSITTGWMSANRRVGVCQRHVVFLE